MLKLNFLFLFLFSVLTIVLCSYFGTYNIDFSHISQDAQSRFVLFEYRLPRVLVSFFAGAGLSLAGLLFQCLFRNPLMTPFTLGVASGSSLGAVIWLSFSGPVAHFGMFGLNFFSLIGAALSLGVLYYVMYKHHHIGLKGLLLVGVSLNLFSSSLVVLFQFLASSGDSQKIIRWLIGGIEVSGMRSLWFILPFVVFTLFWSIKNSHSLNLISMGEDVAFSRGLNIRYYRKMLIISASFLVAGITAECGPISFIGIIIPHVARRITKFDHKDLVCVSFFLGGIFLCVCDTLVRVGSDLLVLPVGVITSLIGGPFFFYILLNKRDSNEF